jgi:hypothetical protein
MIKLEKRELQVLEQASGILNTLYYNSTEEERTELDIFYTQLGIDGIILHQSNMKKNGGE